MKNALIFLILTVMVSISYGQKQGPPEPDCTPCIPPFVVGNGVDNTGREDICHDPNCPESTIYPTYYYTCILAKNPSTTVIQVSLDPTYTFAPGYTYQWQIHGVTTSPSFTTMTSPSFTSLAGSTWSLNGTQIHEGEYYASLYYSNGGAFVPVSSTCDQYFFYVFDPYYTFPLSYTKVPEMCNTVTLTAPDLFIMSGGPSACAPAPLYWQNLVIDWGDGVVEKAWNGTPTLLGIPSAHQANTWAQSHQYSVSGSYYVTVTLNNGYCGDIVEHIIVNVSPVGGYFLDQIYTKNGSYVTVSDMARDLNGNVYITGTFDDKTYFNGVSSGVPSAPWLTYVSGTNYQGMFLARLDGCGSVVWEKSFTIPIDPGLQKKHPFTPNIALDPNSFGNSSNKADLFWSFTHSDAGSYMGIVDGVSSLNGVTQWHNNTPSMAQSHIIADGNGSVYQAGYYMPGGGSLVTRYNAAVGSRNWIQSFPFNSGAVIALPPSLQYDAYQNIIILYDNTQIININPASSAGYATSFTSPITSVSANPLSSRFALVNLNGGGLYAWYFLGDFNAYQGSLIASPGSAPLIGSSNLFATINSPMYDIQTFDQRLFLATADNIWIGDISSIAPYHLNTINFASGTTKINDRCMATNMFYSEQIYFGGDYNLNQSLSLGSTVSYSDPGSFVTRYNVHLTHFDKTSAHIGDNVAAGTIADAKGFSVYPNPVQNLLSFDYSTQSAGPVSLRVYDIQGREVINKIVSEGVEKGDYKAELNVSSLNTGLYFYEFSSDKVYKGKFVKE